MGNGPEPSRRPKVMRVSTRCRTVDELIAAFATLVDEHSLVVLTDQQRVIGSRQPFVVELSDGTFVMRGEAEVVESTAPPKGRLRLKFLALDAGGREVHQRMLERKRGATVIGSDSPPTQPRAKTGGDAKPLVRIPEVPRSPAIPTPVPVGAKKEESGKASSPPAPFARPVPSVPRQPTPSVPVSTLPPPKIQPKTTPKPGEVRVVAPLGKKGNATLMVPVVPPPEPRTPKPVSETPLAPKPVHEPERPKQVTPAPVPVVKPAPAPPPPPEPELIFEDTKVEPKRDMPVEERTPGSPYILPANPFADVVPDALEAFVECTLFEETGRFDLATHDLEPLLDDGVDDDPPIDPPPPPPTPVPVAAAPFDPPPPPVVAAAPPPAVPPPAVTFLPTPAAGSQPLYEPPPTLPLAAPPDTGRFDEDDISPPQKPLPWKWIAVAGVITMGLAIGLVASQLGGGDDASANANKGSGTASAAKKLPSRAPADAAPAPVASADAGTANTVVAAVTPDAAAAAPIPTRTPPDAGPSEPPNLSSGDCHLTLTTEAGAAVALDGHSLGTAPVDADVPCGRAHLVIEHPRYAKLDRVITLVAGTPLELKLNLQRPQLHLRVISKPSGAAVTVDGNSIGRAPAVTTVSGFEMLTVSVNLAGYTAWSQKVYVKKDMMVVNASLQRAGRKHR